MYYGIPILKGLLVIIFTYLLRLDNQNLNGYLTFEILFLNMYLLCRPVASGGAGGARAPPVFGRTVNPISTRRADYTHHRTTSPSGFSDLATVLLSVRKK